MRQHNDDCIMCTCVYYTTPKISSANMSQRARNQPSSVLEPSSDHQQEHGGGGPPGSGGLEERVEGFNGEALCNE